MKTNNRPMVKVTKYGYELEPLQDEIMRLEKSAKHYNEWQTVWYAEKDRFVKGSGRVWTLSIFKVQTLVKWRERYEDYGEQTTIYNLFEEEWNQY